MKKISHPLLYIRQDTVLQNQVSSFHHTFNSKPECCRNLLYWIQLVANHVTKPISVVKGFFIFSTRLRLFANIKVLRDRILKTYWENNSVNRKNKTKQNSF